MNENYKKPCVGSKEYYGLYGYEEPPFYHIRTGPEYIEALTRNITLEDIKKHVRNGVMTESLSFIWRELHNLPVQKKYNELSTSVWMRQMELTKMKNSSAIEKQENIVRKNEEDLDYLLGRIMEELEPTSQAVEAFYNRIGRDELTKLKLI